MTTSQSKPGALIPGPTGSVADGPHAPSSSLQKVDDAASRTSQRRAGVQIGVDRLPTGGFATKPAPGCDEDTMRVQVANAMGTRSRAFIESTFSSLLTVFGSQSGQSATRDLNTALAVLDGMQPENEVEAMLLTQMVVTNEAAMRCLAMIDKRENGAEVFGGLATKLLRTFTAQTEALAKLRRKGEQTVRVVHVHSGGQAVVAETINQGGASQYVDGQSFGPDVAIAPGATMLGADTSRDRMPVASDAGTPALPYSRRPKSRRTKG